MGIYFSYICKPDKIASHLNKLRGVCNTLFDTEDSDLIYSKYGFEIKVEFDVGNGYIITMTADYIADKNFSEECSKLYAKVRDLDGAALVKLRKMLSEEWVTRRNK